MEKQSNMIPAEYCHVPYGYKFKKGHATVHDYIGSLANAQNDYTELDNEYGRAFTEENIIYSNKEDAIFTVTLKEMGKHVVNTKAFGLGVHRLNSELMAQILMKTIIPFITMSQMVN